MHLLTHSLNTLTLTPPYTLTHHLSSHPLMLSYPPVAVAKSLRAIVRAPLVYKKDDHYCRHGVETQGDEGG